MNQDSTQKTILIIEDKLANIEMVINAMQDQGFELITARDGEMGLRRAELSTPDLILLDVILPDINGFEVCRRLKANKQTQHIPVLFMTIVAETKDIVKGFQVGAVDYIPKPVQTEELLARVTTHLQLEAQKEQLQRAHDELEQRVAERTVELAQANTRLKASEEKYRELVENINDVIFIVDVEGIITYISPAIKQMSGYAPEEIMKRPFSEFVHPEDLPGLLQSFQHTISGQLNPFEYRTISKSGELRWVHSNSKPIYENGQISGLQGTLVDITERKQTEKKLRDSEEIFRQFFENDPTYCYMVSSEGTLLNINKAALDTLGYAKEELIGQPLKMIYAPESLPQWEKNVIEWNKTGKLKDIAMTIMTKTGEKRSVLLSAGAILDNDQNIRYSIAVQKDITDWKQLEDRLRQSQKMEAIGRLTGGVAHDFNNLLTVISTYSDLALLITEPQSKSQRYIKQIKNAGKQAASLTQQLLAFSRQQVLQSEALNLNTVVTESEDIFRRLAGVHIEIVLNLEPSLGIVTIDRGQMQQVLMNLIANARDAMPEGGRLVIETTNVDLDTAYVDKHPEMEPGTYVELSVTDTGFGMDADTKERIFDPFFTTKELSKGTGLGLATVHGIVKQCGGHIWVYSELGQGTTFKIYFPQTGQIKPIIQQGQSQVSHSSSTFTILVLDDEPSLLNSIKEILEAAGHTVLPTQTGEAAKKMWAKHQGEIDLFITDIALPGKENGVQVANSLVDQNQNMQVLFISGYTSNVISHKGVLDQGINFLPKPFTASELLNKVFELLEPTGSHS